MYSLAESFFTRTPFRSWAEVDAAADTNKDPEPFELHRIRMVPRFDGKKTLRMGHHRGTQVMNDHLLMRVTGGWRVIRRGV